MDCKALLVFNVERLHVFVVNQMCISKGRRIIAELRAPMVEMDVTELTPVYVI